MIWDNGFTEISCFSFVSLKIGGPIYTDFPMLLEWIIWIIEGLRRLHLTECVKWEK